MEPCSLLGGSGTPCLPAQHLKQIEKFTGRPCPRVELLDANVEVVACVSEMRALGDSPAACDDAYQDATGSLAREERREFRRKMAVYRNELDKLLRENADHRATAKAGNPTKPRGKQGLSAGHARKRRR